MGQTREGPRDLHIRLKAATLGWPRGAPSPKCAAVTYRPITAQRPHLAPIVHELGVAERAWSRRSFWHARPGDASRCRLPMALLL